MKRIGNMWCVGMLWSMALVGQGPVNIQLTVKTVQSLPLHEAALRKPFMATVTVNAAASVDKIFLEAPAAFELRNQGTTTSMNSINGVTSHETSIQYSVRAKELGTFTLGPATVTIDGQLYTSNTVSVTVEKEPIDRETRKEPWLEIRVPEGPFVLGEQVPIALRFYHLGLAQLSSLEPPRVQGFLLSALEGPTKGIEEIDGGHYEYIEWRSHMAASELGTFSVGPARAIYGMKPRERMHVFQLLVDHFSFGMQQYETDSNVVELTVKPLPSHQGPVHAVGNFTQLEAAVQQTTAKQGEGIVFTLTLDGLTTMKDLAHPKLILPSAVTAYESKSSITTHQGPGLEERKIFEYILQSREPGIITIPAQVFTFYDTQAKQYKQLASLPITLTITPSDAGASSTSAAVPEKTSAQDLLSTASTTLPLYVAPTGAFLADRALPDLFFWLLICVILSVLVALWGYSAWQWYCMRNAVYLRSRASFRKAYKRLHEARRERDVRALYALFVDLFADKRGIVANQIVASDMVSWLQEAHLPAETIKQWQAYCNELQAYAFYDVQKIPSIDIFTQAEKWLALLEKTV